MMVCCEHKAIIIDVDTLDQLKILNINKDVEGDENPQLQTPLITKHMIPDTDFKFMLECYGSQYIRLRTVETGARQILIQDTPKCPKQIPCSFFLKSSDGYELHFCTVTQKKGTILNSWYRWYLGPDFFKMLRKYGRLPLEMSIEKIMDNMKERDALQRQLQ